MVPDIGVCGGVVSGTPPTEVVVAVAAAMLGTLPNVGVGFVIIAFGGGVGAKVDDCTEEIEFERAGLDGRIVGAGDEGGRDGVGGFGVGPGVACGDAKAAGIVGWCSVGTLPGYTCPSSPGVKERVEQKPSEELIRRVSPSVDLARVSGRSKRGQMDSPCEVCECRKVQITDDAQRRLLLRIVHQHSVLRGHGIDDPIGQRKGRQRSRLGRIRVWLWGGRGRRGIAQGQRRGHVCIIRQLHMVRQWAADKRTRTFMIVDCC